MGMTHSPFCVCSATTFDLCSIRMKVRRSSSKRLGGRLGSLSKNDSPSPPPPAPPPSGTRVEKVPVAIVTPIVDECVESLEGYGEHFVQRCIIIQRDEKGYGLTVSGDNPVFVQSVRDDGAAARAGVQRGDRIIKVNGTLVTQSNHLEVVKLIKSGSYVALTLLSRLKGAGGQCPNSVINSGVSSDSSSPPPSQQPVQRRQSQHHHHHHHLPHLPNSHSFPSHNSHQHHHHHGNMNASNRSTSLSERITAPFPVDAELQQELHHSRHQTMLQMLEQERDYLEKIRCAFARNPSAKLKVELKNAQKLIASLEQQVLMMRMSPSETPAAKSPVSGLQQEPPPPPPPPRRHVSLPHQSSSLPSSVLPPVPPLRVESRVSKLAALSGGGNGDCHQDVVVASPGSPPPRPCHIVQLDNMQKLNALASGTRLQSTGPTHSRQRSSPDAILHLIENARHYHHQCHQQHLHSPDLTRSHSDVTASSSVRKLQSAESCADLDSSKRRRTCDAIIASRGSSFGAGDSASTDSPCVTPPGTPPPPYGSFETSGESAELAPDGGDPLPVPESSSLSPPSSRPLSESGGDRRSGSSDLHVFPASECCSPTEGQSQGRMGPCMPQQPIISMEEDDFPLDGESGPANDHGPYNSLSQLCNHPGHLSVFIHFLISNSDPASLFFYLIACMYKEGNAKDMRKWAYEIHSTFLVPGSPLKVNNVDEAILHEIDSVLQNDLEKEEVLRNVFEKAQQRAVDELSELLADFRNKRTLGLGSIFGPSDAALKEAIRDKAKETKIIEQGLLPLLESFSEDLENAKDRESAIASSLASLLYKLFNLKSAQAMSVIERSPMFVTRDTKSKGIKFLKGNKKNFLLTMGHHFNPQHYFNVTYCNHCQLIIWGVGNQGFQCQYCDMNIHKNCVRVVEETCIGGRSGGKKDKKRDRVAGIVENIIGKSRKPSQNAVDRQRRIDESGDNSAVDSPSESCGEKSVSAGRVDKLCKTFEAVNENDGNHRDGALQQHHSCTVSPVDASSPSGSSRRGSQVVRSESLRTRRESKPSFRKRSDPNIPRSNSDVDGDDRPVSGLNQSGSSSNSSLSTKSLDSPSNSLEAVHRSTTEVPLPPPPPPSLAAPSSSSSAATSPLAPLPVPLLHRRDENEDSDFDVEPDPPNWADLVDPEVVRHIKPKEKKRQDVINELIYTERTHVRNLKVLEKVFYRPMMVEQVLPFDQIKLLFANLEEMIEVHGRLNSRLKAAKKENQVVGDVGDVLLQMFDGSSGEAFREAAATFCKNQSFALEALKVRQKKDQKLAQFLLDASGNALCRRFQLKDIIPTGMQRLTKYPLLLENLAKYTCPTTDEHRKIMRALDCSKDILNYVNQAVKVAENYHKLIEIQKKMDRGPFEKIAHPITQEFRNLDLTRYKMQHVGNLTWRIVRQKSIEVQVLLLEDIMVLLQKQDEKFVLKYHNTSLTAGKEETKLIYSPIIKLNNLLARNVATDKRAFFLVSTSPVGPQMYELVAMSSNDRKTWLRHISEATEAYKTRDGKTKRPEHVSSAPERRGSTEDASGITPSEEGFKSPEPLDMHESQEIQDVVSEGSSGGPEAATSTVLSENPETKSGGTTTTATDLSTGTNSESEEGEGPSSSSSTTLVPQGRLSPLPATATPSGASSSGSPSPRRHFQRVEILQIAEGPALIDPNEVVVSEGAVLQTAEPVLAPIEKLRRKDQAIRSALQDKLHLVSEILHIPPASDKEETDDVATRTDPCDGDVKDLLMAALTQATRLDKVIEGLKISEEDAVTATADGQGTVTGSLASAASPTCARKVNRVLAMTVDQLVSISSILNSNLTQLLALVVERETERERLRKEVRASREQIHLLHDARRRTTTPLSQSPSHSRPNSFVSVGSSGSDVLLADTDRPQCVPDDDCGGGGGGAGESGIEISVEVPSTLEAYNKLVSVALMTALQVSTASKVSDGSDSKPDNDGDEHTVELFVDAPSESCTEDVEPPEVVVIPVVPEQQQSNGIVESQSWQQSSSGGGQEEEDEALQSVPVKWDEEDVPAASTESGAIF